MIKQNVTTLASIKNNVTDVTRVYKGTDLIYYQSDSDAEAFITATAITNDNQKTAIADLVVGLKADGLWNKLVAIYPMVGGTATTHKYNLKDPRDLDAAFRLSFNGTWTHSATGAKGNGTDNWADTFVVPYTHLSTDGAGGQTNGGFMGFYSRTQTTDPGQDVDMGVQSGSGSFFMAIRWTAGEPQFLAVNGAQYLRTPADSTTTGWFTVARNSATEIEMSRDNVVQHTITDSPTGYANASIFLGAYRYGEANYLFPTERECAFAVIGKEALTTTEKTNLYNRIVNFQTKLNRQIGLDSDVASFLNATGITDTRQKNAITNLVASLKAQGLWTRLDAVYPMIGGTSATHKYNLKDPRDLDAAYRLSFNGGWTHSATGATPDGSTAWADTFYVPSVQGEVKTLSYYSRVNFLGGNSHELGINATTSDVSLQIYNVSTGFSEFSLNSTEATTTPNATTNTSGLFTASKPLGGTGVILKRNSELLAETTVTEETPLPSQSVFLGAERNAIGGGFNGSSTRECAFAAIGWSDNINELRADRLFGIIETFQYELGRTTYTVNDTDANAFISATGITAENQKAAVVNLVAGLKADGLWDKLNAIYPMVGGTATTHKYNLKDPRDLDAAYRLTFSGGWTHSSTGAKPNGTDAWAQTHFTPTSSMGILGYYSRTSSTKADAIDMGAAATGGVYLTIRYDGTNGVVATMNSAQILGSANSVTRGWWTAHRNDSTTIEVRHNGQVYLTGTSRPIIGTPTETLLLGAMENSAAGQTAVSFSDRECAFGVIGTTYLTSTEKVNLYNRVQEFQSLLSRQINL